MIKNHFQQVLVMVMKSELFVQTPKLELPILSLNKGYDTPYLRRRKHSRLRG